MNNLFKVSQISFFMKAILLSAGFGESRTIFKKQAKLNTLSFKQFTQ